MTTATKPQETQFRAIWDADTAEPARGTVGTVVLLEADYRPYYLFMPDYVDDSHLCDEQDFIRLLASIAV